MRNLEAEVPPPFVVNGNCLAIYPVGTGMDGMEEIGSA
jgi:hypothetical protein